MQAFGHQEVAQSSRVSEKTLTLVLQNKNK